MLPKSFDIIVKDNDRYNQVRIFDKGTKSLNIDELICLHREQGILFVNGKKMSEKNFLKRVEDDTVKMSIDLKANCFGYIAKKIQWVYCLTELTKN